MPTTNLNGSHNLRGAGAQYLINDVPLTGAVLQREVRLISQSDDTQEASALDDPIQIEFGPAQTTDNFDLDADGNVTCLVAGTYEFNMFFQYGRTGASGTSWLYTRVLINGFQGGSTSLSKMENSNSDSPYQVIFSTFLDVGWVFSMETMRGSEGANSGGLIATDPAMTGWDYSPSVLLEISETKLA